MWLFVFSPLKRSNDAWEYLIMAHERIIQTSGQVITRAQKVTTEYWCVWILFLFKMCFFLISVGCSGQLARITTIPHRPLNTLQVQWAGKTPRGWQAYAEKVELGTAEGDKPPHTAEARPSSVFKMRFD